MKAFRTQSIHLSYTATISSSQKNQTFLFWGFLSFVRKALKKVKITGLKHHYDNFNKKVDISDEEKTETQWCINNIDKAFETLEAIFNMHLKWKIHQNN